MKWVLFTWISALAAALPSAPISDWVYVLQHENVGPAQLAATTFDLVVMDAEGPERPWQTSDLAALHTAGQIALAYLSIGQAENFRDYWQSAWDDEPPLGQPDADAPEWLGPADPDWPECYMVRYWDPHWQALVFQRLDAIVASGFDGVYCDIIDAWYYWSPQGEGRELGRDEARHAMANFVAALRARARHANPNFLVFGQNGEEIVWDESEHVDTIGEIYLNAIDGVGAEDVWYDATETQPPDEVTYRLKLLRDIRSHGKTVLVADYVWNPAVAGNRERFNTFYTQALAEGFVPYAALSDRELDRIVLVEAASGFNYSQPLTPRTSGIVSARQRSAIYRLDSASGFTLCDILRMFRRTLGFPKNPSSHSRQALRP